MKLLYGTYQYAKPGDMAILNFSGLIEGYTNVNLLPEGLDPQTVANFEEREFDNWYANYLLIYKFYNIMSFLTILQQVEILYLIIGSDDWSYTLIESFLKFLQVRYGITGTLIQSEEDILYAGETDFEPHYGITAYDGDFMIYQEALERDRIMEGGKPNVE